MAQSYLHDVADYQPPPRLLELRDRPLIMLVCRPTKC